MQLNFDQYFYPETKLLYAARAAGVQAHGMGAQHNVDFVSISMGKEAMLNACRYAYTMGFLGTSVIHPSWVEADAKENESDRTPAWRILKKRR